MGKAMHCRPGQTTVCCRKRFYTYTGFCARVALITKQVNLLNPLLFWQFATLSDFDLLLGLA